MERTFVAVKPDGVRRGLAGEVIARFERKGFRIVGMKMLVVDADLAAKHYGEHAGKPFYAELVSFITSGPVVAFVVEGADAVAQARNLIGATRPKEAAPGSIRGDLATEVGQNIVHGSDSPASAEREIALWFKPAELLR